MADNNKIQMILNWFSVMIITSWLVMDAARALSEVNLSQIIA